MTKYIKCFYRIISLIMLLFICITNVNASSLTRKVKVGIFPLANFNIIENNTYSGYNYDYLMKIQELTLWEYEFIEINDWPTALKMLENKEIDLLSPGQITEERHSKFLFSDFETGIEYGSFLTLNDRTDLIFNDLENFDDQTFGCVTTSIFRDDFEAIADKYNYYGNVKFYENSNNMLSALKNGEIDIAVANLMQQSNNEYRILAKFSPSSQYYMTYIGNEDLMADLNYALYTIKAENSQFQNELLNKYYPAYSALPFDKEDYEYINKNYVLNVAVMQNADPISYIDSNGNLSGITVKILDKIAEYSNLTFNYVVVDGNIDKSFLYNNQIDLIANTKYNNVNANLNELKLSYPYYDGKNVLVSLNHEALDNNQIYTVGITESSKTYTKQLTNSFSNFEIIEYEDDETGLHALLNDEIDFFLQNRYIIERYLMKPRYSKLHIVNNWSIDDRQSLALVLYKQDGTINEKTYGTHLTSLLNKVIQTIPASEINDIVISQTSARPYVYTLTDFIEQYIFYISMILAALIIIIVLTINVLHLKNKNLKIMKENEAKLNTIMNNTNAGIISLHLDTGIIVEEANAGLLKLLRITTDDLKSESAVILDHASVKTINKLIENPPSDSHVKLQLRIIFDDNYIETIFIGTLTIDDGRYIMYAVAVDVSEQQNLIHELESQQSRYTLLMKKSDSIIFEYSLKDSNLTIEPKFKEKFGWEFTNIKLDQNHEITNYIHPNDLSIITDIFKNLLIGEEGIHCRIRLLTIQNEVVWCDISGYTMMANNKPTTIIGTIKDVSIEVNEQVNLRRQARLDALTGVLNKQAFYEESTHYLVNNRHHANAVIFLDLDNFKAVNDTLGHMAGDQAIIDTATKLQKTFANIDIISRFGGDEFCIFVKDISKRTLIDKLNWTLEKLSTIYSDGTNHVAVTTSIGVALTPKDGNDIHTLMEAADKALYYSKANGKNRYTFYEESLEVGSYKGRNKK